MPVLRGERHGATLLLTVSREHAGNSISAEVTAAFENALDQAELDRSLRAVVISGAGDRFFSSGGDIKQYRALRTREQLERAFARPRALMDRIEALPVPVIAAINGWALGGGAELALACDIRIAAVAARLGFPYVRLGLMPGWHGGERLLRTVGYAAAMRLLMSGEAVDAGEACRIGLLSEVVDEVPVVDAALALAAHFEQAAPLSLGAIKQSLRAAQHHDQESARALADGLFADLWLSEDHREAEAAFTEKRPPMFRGK